MTPTVAVDIGGTFTDVVLEDAAGRRTVKVPTTPAAPAEGVMSGLARVLDAAGRSAAEIGLVLHGTTLATNAILERKGAVTALVTTAGFRDVLEIGYETRFDQYDLMIEKPVPLIPRHLRFGVRERVDVAGQVRRPLETADVEALPERLDAAGVTSVAVAYMHGYAAPDHEERTRDLLARARPDLSISLASEVCPEIREYERFVTASANAYVRPLMESYLHDLEGRLRAAGFACPVLMMTSGGSLCTLATAAALPVRLVESGPAGGAIFAASIARELGHARTLAFDMGGTTAKTCLLAEGRPRMAREFEVDRASGHQKGSGLPIRIPVIEMVEIGAGGGSIARLDTLERIQVGPHSAGADPGPAAFGRGGTSPTVTDADIVLGRIPATAMSEGTLDLQPELARAALDRDIGTPLGLSAQGAAIGVAAVIEETMANAARRHVLERGLDAADHALIAFGGAAPLHACAVARKLGIRTVVIPADAGVGSAVGFLTAPVAFDQVASLFMRLSAFDAAPVNALFDGLATEARDVVSAAAPDAPLTETRQAFVRYVGQGHEIAVDLAPRPLRDDDADGLRQAFEDAYARQFGRIIPGAEIEVLSWGFALAADRAPRAATPPAAAGSGPSHGASVDLVDPATGEVGRAEVRARRTIASDDRIAGPALIVEEQTTTVLPRGFTATLGNGGALILEDAT